MKFKFHNPTQIIFGPGRVSQIGKVVSAHGKKALLVTGGGSVKRNGTFERVVSSLEASGISVVECSGIEPNPRITSVRRGAQIALDQGCDVIVALGGGSTMDASKAIGAALFYDGDPWDMIWHGQPNPYYPRRALPIITVPTIAATGSEMNNGAVISNEETSEKSFVKADCLYPKVALVDPELTMSVPPDQTGFGVCDMITHVTESYFNGPDNTPLQDRFAEGVILTAMEWGPKAIAQGDNIEARAHVQWSSIVALNGCVQAGSGAGYPVHMIEHTLSAYHDITHAAGLAVINPAWMRFAAKHRLNKFLQFAERIFGLKTENSNDIECALKGINHFEQFLKSIGCPTRLSELNIDEKLFSRYAQDTLCVIHDKNGNLPGRPPMSESDIINVLRSAL